MCVKVIVVPWPLKAVLWIAFVTCIGFAWAFGDEMLTNRDETPRAGDRFALSVGAAGALGLVLFLTA